MDYKDYLQKKIYVIINPIIKGMLKLGFTPNSVTITGFILNVFATGLVLYATASFNTPNTALIGWSGGIILFAGLFDMMDGRLARVGKKESPFGALLDSTLDRYSELFTLFGFSIFLIRFGWLYSGITTFLAMVGSVMVSYVRARAEGLGIECKVGFMQRPERVVLTSIGAICCGILSNIWALVIPLIFIAVFANITAFWRIAHCYKVLSE